MNPPVRDPALSTPAPKLHTSNFAARSKCVYSNSCMYSEKMPLKRPKRLASVWKGARSLHFLLPPTPQLFSFTSQTRFNFDGFRRLLCSSGAVLVHTNETSSSNNAPHMLESLSQVLSSPQQSPPGSSLRPLLHTVALFKSSGATGALHSRPRSSSNARFASSIDPCLFRFLAERSDGWLAKHTSAPHALASETAPAWPYPTAISGLLLFRTTTCAASHKILGEKNADWRLLEVQATTTLGENCSSDATRLQCTSLAYLHNKT